MTLHRTRDELLNGSAAFRPLSSREFTEWAAFMRWRNRESAKRQKEQS